MSAISGSSSSAELSASYMELLVTQMKYQDPSEPMSNEALTQQLAMLSQLEQTEKLNASFQQMLHSQNLGEANQMIGRVVSFVPSELGEEISGVVSGATIEEDTVQLVVGPYKVKIEDVLALSPYYSDGSGGGTATSSLIGDLNNDGIVNEVDRETLMGNYGVQANATVAMGDLTGDGAIDAADYDILMEHYGEYLEGSEAASATDSQA